MSSLKQLKTRIRSIKSTQKITKAMKMVSAVKFKRIRAKLEDSCIYTNILSDILKEIILYYDLKKLPEKFQKFFSEQNLEKPTLFIVFTSERGLCGGFNSTLIKKIKLDIENLKQNQRQIRLIVIGKKGYDLLKTNYMEYISDYFNFTKENKDNLILQIKEKIVNLIEAEEIGSCYLYFNKFKNAMIQAPFKQQILPIEKEIIDKKQPESEYEGDNIVKNLISLYIVGQLKFALLESRASEESSRMLAMDNATNNASDIIDGLTLKMNRTRQAMITKELVEIISGAELV